MKTSILLHELVPIPRVIIDLYEPWMAVILLISLLVFAIVKNQFPAYLQLIGWNFSNYRIARQYFEESEFTFRPEWLLMFPIMVGSLALYVYLLMAGFSEFCMEDGLFLYLRLLLIIFMIYVVKLLTIQLVSTLSTPIKTLRVYLGNVILLNQTVALPVIILSVLAALTAGWVSRTALIAAAVILIGVYALRVLRGIVSALQERIPLNYIILYLCTLEFLPLAVLVKAWVIARAAC